MTVLAFGIYQRSRVAATSMFVYFFVSKICQWVHSASVIGIGGSLVFVYLYLQAMRGTFRLSPPLKVNRPLAFSLLLAFLSLSLALVGYALLLRGYHLLKGRNVVISERWTSYLTLVYFAFYAFDYFFVSGGFVAATVHMVLFIMVIKIFSVQRDRDLVYLAVLSFLMVLAAAVLTVDTIFLLMFCMFMLTAMATFISMEMRRSEREAASVVVTAREENRFNRSLSGAIGSLAVLTFGGAAIIFFILPRMSMGGVHSAGGTSFAGS